MRVTEVCRVQARVCVGGGTARAHGAASMGQGAWGTWHDTYPVRHTAGHDTYPVRHTAGHSDQASPRFKIRGVERSPGTPRARVRDRGRVRVDVALSSPSP